MKKILVVDGNSIINRAYYGIRALTNSAGKPTNAVFGAVNIIERQLEAIRPDYAAVAFDLHAPTFRHKMYDAYKAGRRETPEDLIVQFPEAKECLAAMGLHILELEGYEADDLQGTVAAMVNGLPDGHAYVLSGDRDLFQLIDDKTTVLYAGSETVAYDRERFGEKYPGVTPEQFVDLKALMGDASDNIPGVAGVGEKTALKLISSFGSLDGVYENINDPGIANGVREKLLRSKEDAYLSKTLATILRSAPLGMTLDDLAYNGFQRGRLYRKFRELELNSLISRFRLSPEDSDGEDEESGNEQTELKDGKRDYLDISFFQALAIGDKFAFHSANDEIYLANGEDCYHLLGSLSDIAELFAEGKTVICYDGKYLCHALYHLGITPACTFADISLYAYVLNSSLGVATLPALAKSYLRVAVDDETPSAHILYDLERKLSDELSAIHALDLVRDVELPLLPILAEMEETGFRIDTEGLRAYGEELKTTADRYAAHIQELAGHPFNVNSTKQLAEVLFDELGLTPPKKKHGGYSTDAETLEKLRGDHPIIEEILLYRQLTKLYSTYAVGLLSAADEAGRLHTDFKQALTATGRLSSAEPNLQNIPIRTPMGREMRRYFIPSDGCVLVDADYSQIELRLLAVLSGDTHMTDAFLSGADIHTATAASAFRVPIEEVTPALRKSAKAINFGIVYGIGAYSLSEDLHISVREAKEYIENYLRTYPEVDAYLNETVAHAAEVGYTETLYGRRRYIPELSSPNGALRTLGRRIALNAPIQGTAADIMKMAMVRVHRALKEELPSAKLLMQVHDELVLECPEEDAERAGEILKREMEQVAAFCVPLTVEVVTGTTWLK